MTVLEEIDGGGDSAQLMDQLMRLQERKAELNKNLEQIQDRNQELRQLVALKKTQIAVLQEDVKSSDERIAELRNSSTTLDKKAKVLEQEANSCRDSVQKMKQKLMDKKWQHFKDIDQKTAELNSIAKHMLQMSVQFKPGQQVDNKSDKAIDAEIERLSKKQSFLEEELEKRKAGAKSGASSAGRTVHFEEPDLSLTDYKWKDWPISHRMIATKVFVDEHQLLRKDLEFLQQYIASQEMDIVSDSQKTDGTSIVGLASQ